MLTHGNPNSQVIERLGLTLRCDDRNSGADAIGPKREVTCAPESSQGSRHCAGEAEGRLDGCAPLDTRCSGHGAEASLSARKILLLPSALGES